MRCTKVGHKIRNLKGQEPLVCSEHKIVKSEYCQTCDVPVCFKCLPKHGKHEPNPLEPKASNRKRKIDNFAQNESIEVDNFAQNEIIEQQENNEDIFNKDPDEEELCDTENIEPDIHPQNEMIIEQQENDQDIYGIDPDEEGLYATVDPNDVSYNPYFEMEELAVNSQKSTRRPVKRAESTPANKNKSKQAKGTSQLDPRDEQLENDKDIYDIDPDEEGLYATVDPNNVNIFANVEMKAPAVNSQKSTRRPVKRVESTPANKNKSKQAKGTSQLDPRDEFLVKVGQDFKHAAQMHQDSASQQVNSMRSLEAAIEKLANRNYYEIQSSKETRPWLKSLIILSLRCLLMALTDFRLSH